MKLKSKILSALVLGLSSCITFGVSAFGGDDDSGSESGSSGCCASVDSDSDSFPSASYSGSCIPMFARTHTQIVRALKVMLGT